MNGPARALLMYTLPPYNRVGFIASICTLNHLLIIMYIVVIKNLDSYNDFYVNINSLLYLGFGVEIWVSKLI